MTESFFQPEEMQIAQQKVARFVERHEPSYRLLLYHAALPLVLTPELLNYLRTKFVQQVPWVAEADLLLSDLCQQVGYEQYVMDSAVRAYLLQEMKQDAALGPERMEAVARLLIHYVRYLSKTDAYLDAHELQAQQWAAMVYIEEQRETTVREIQTAFEDVIALSTSANVNPATHAAEAARLARITQELVTGLESYPELVAYATNTTRLIAATGVTTTERVSSEEQAGRPSEQRPTQEIVALSPSLYSSLHKTLMNLSVFDSDQELQAIFADVRIALWCGVIPSVSDRGARVDSLIAQLLALWNDHDENALCLFLRVLSELTSRQEIAELANQIESTLVNSKIATITQELRTLEEHLKNGQIDSFDYAEQKMELRAAIERWQDRLSHIKHSHARLHQLPQPPHDFVGREEELEMLRTTIESGSALITGLHGMGGAGKTALALKLAEMLTPRYPDAQFYLDLRGTDTAPLSPVEVMTAILRTYYPTARLPEDLTQLQTVYHATLNGQRALLLFDNAAGKDQLLPLLPPASCRLIVTSRHRFSLPGLHSLDLDALPHVDACTLLRQIAPRVGDYAEELADLCSCLPLALRWAGEALNDTVLPVERFLERLQHERRLLEPAEAALRLSYDLLAPELQALWRQLSIFPGEFDKLAAIAVWKIDQKSAEDVLDALARRSLLMTANDRYLLNDLIRLWAREQTTDDERNAVAYRHAAHYEQMLRNANILYLQGHEDILEGLTLYDREAHNIHSGFAWASSFFSSYLQSEKKKTEIDIEQERASLCNAYLDAGSYILELRLHPRERIAWLEAALRAARAIGRRDAEGAHLGNLGLAYAALGDARRAIEFYEQVLAITREIGDRRGEGNALGNLGLAYAALGDARRAIELYEQALVITREIGDRRGESNALGNLGLAYAALGDARRAIVFYEQALVITREIGDRRGEGNALGNLGAAYAALGDARRASTYYEQYLVIAREIGDQRGEGNALSNLGLVYAALGDAHRAIELYEQALAITREIGDRRGEGVVLSNLGNAYADLGDMHRAIGYYEQFLSIVRETGDRRGEGNALGNLGVALANLGDIQQAIKYYEQRLAIAREIGDRRGEGTVLGNLGNAYKSLGDTRNAIEFYEQALGIYREIGDRRGDGTVLMNIGNVHYSLGDIQRAIGYYEQTLQIVREIGDRRGEGNVCWNLGLAYEKLGHYAEACELMRVSIEIKRAIGYPNVEQDAQHLTDVCTKM